MVLRQGDAHWVSPQTIAKAHVLQVKAWVLACCHKPETLRQITGRVRMTLRPCRRPAGFSAMPIMAGNMICEYKKEFLTFSCKIRNSFMVYPAGFEPVAFRVGV